MKNSTLSCYRCKAEVSILVKKQPIPSIRVTSPSGNYDAPTGYHCPCCGITLGEPCVIQFTDTKHDQLTADNQRLREALKELVEELSNKGIVIRYDDGDVAIEMFLDEALNSTHPTNHLTDKERVKKEKE